MNRVPTDRKLKPLARSDRMPIKLSSLILTLTILTISGCKQPVPSIYVTNESTWPLHVVSLSNMDHFKRDQVLAGETKAVVTQPSFTAETITIKWYIVGAPKALPAIRENSVPIPKDWDGRAPLTLSFDQKKKWTAAFQ